MRQAALTVLTVLLAAGFALGGLSAKPVRSQVTTAPVVTAVSPNSGPVTGGTSVTISGTGFTGATNVIFQGGTGPDSANFTVNSATQITATSPPSPLPSPGTGTVDIIVQTAGGTSPISGADKFTYTAGGGSASFNGLTYVVSPDGNDAQTCLLPPTASSPTSTFACSTIQGAVSKTRDGDTIAVLSGVYNVAQPIEVPDLIKILAATLNPGGGITPIATQTIGSVTTTTSTTSTSNCAISGGGLRVILRSASGQPIFHVTAEGSPALLPIIAGFTLGGATSLVNPGAIQLDGTSYAEIECNIIGQEDLPNGIGILLRDADNALIFANTIHGNSQFPISASLGPTPPVGGFGIVTSECLGSGHSDDAWILNNLLAMNSNAGIFICSDGTGGHLIQGNTVRGNGRGIVLQDANDCAVASNTVQDNYFNGIQVLDSSENDTIANNVIESQDGPNATGISLMGTGELFPLDNVLTGNILRSNATNIYIAGARRTLIGVDKSVVSPVQASGPAGQIPIPGTPNVLTAEGDRTDIVLALGNSSGQAINSASPAFGQPSDTIINDNTLLSNGPCDATRGCAIRLTAGVTVNIDATKNEWGVTSNDQIRAELWDKFWDPALGQVLIYAFVAPPLHASVAPPPATATPQPFAAPPQSVFPPAPLAASASLPPPNVPATATATPAAAVGPPLPPMAYVDPATGTYYVYLTVCVSDSNNKPVANDQLVISLMDQTGGELGMLQATTDSNGCFGGDVAATGGAAEVQPGSLSIMDASGAVTSLSVQAGSPLYRPPTGPLTSSGTAAG